MAPSFLPHFGIADSTSLDVFFLPLLLLLLPFLLLQGGAGNGAEVEKEWLLSKGLRVPRRGREGGEDLVLEGAPLQGLLDEETWEERGWLPPPPCCWDGACVPPAGVGAASLECCPPCGPAPHFRPGHLAHTWLLLGKPLLAARVGVRTGVSHGASSRARPAGSAFARDPASPLEKGVVGVGGQGRMCCSLQPLPSLLQGLYPVAWRPGGEASRHCLFWAT